MGPIIPLYDVIIQAFIDPSNYQNGVIVEPKYVHDTREGVNGKPGLKELCKRSNVTLMISIGGGGAARFVNDDAALINALYDYVQDKGYQGVDIDEENNVPVDTYANFLIAVGKKFKVSGYNVSCTIGPLSCCFQSRGICKAAPYIDWAFLMLYDGLYEGSAFDLPPGVDGALWQDQDGQTYCGIRPVNSSNDGIVSFVATGGCQFIDFALYLKWPADKIVMGIPSYSSPNVLGWFQIKEQNYRQMKDDPVTLVSSYTGPNGQVQLPSDKDVSQRCLKVLHPDLSVLGVTLDNTSWESKILTCSRNATSYSGVTIKGVGFWALGFEDNLHHELSQAIYDCAKKSSAAEQKH